MRKILDCITKVNTNAVKNSENILIIGLNTKTHHVDRSLLSIEVIGNTLKIVLLEELWLLSDVLEQVVFELLFKSLD